MLKDKIYDVLKEAALVWLPALGTLYFGIAEIWGLPYGSEVVATLTAVDLFLGAVLKISTVQYNKNKEYEV